jgi:hypothetical protein
MRRVFGVVALCVLPISLLTVGLSGVASASSPAVTGVTCKVLTANLTGTTGSVTKCNDPTNTGKKGTFLISTLTSGSGNLTWNGTGSTKLTGVTATPVTPGTCPTGDTEYTVTGTVAGGKGAAKKSIKKGWTLAATVCIDSNENVTLLAGTTLQIGPGL